LVVASNGEPFHPGGASASAPASASASASASWATFKRACSREASRATFEDGERATSCLPGKHNDPLTILRPARYTRPVNTRNQWIQGLEWGACAWLGWVAWNSVLRASHCSLYPGSDFLGSLGWFTQRWLLAAVWVAALLLTWTRWSRGGVALAIVAQAVLGSIDGATFGGEFWWWSPTFWIPMSLPVLPLLFMEPARPRLTLSLLMVGRWRDAVAELKGWRWLFVAAGTVLQNRVGWRAFTWFYSNIWVLLSALLFALAAIPRRHESATA
jgi:hypothetical protein